MAASLREEQVEQQPYVFDGAVATYIEERRHTIPHYNFAFCPWLERDGHCSLRASRQCPYRHDAKSVERRVVCKHALRNLCKKGDKCEFLHVYDLSKMPICHFFMNYNACNNPECLYLHTTPEEQLPPCPWYAKRGFCRRGPECDRRHVRKEACADYLAGFCPKGPACSKAHPKYELPREEVDRGDRPDRRVCHACGQPGHIRAACPTHPPTFLEEQERVRRGMRSLKDVTCFKCGESGHYANACTNTRRLPDPSRGAFVSEAGR